MNKEPCPCGSNRPLSQCCLPIITGTSKAATAEQLMRSRYTAFCREENGYLLQTWARKTRPEQLNTSETPVNWIKLEIISHEKGLEEDDDGTVHFIAHFIATDRLCSLEETSRFIKENDAWYYLDGVANSSTTKIPRNAECPCGSHKKFKRCCLRQNSL